MIKDGMIIVMKIQNIADPKLVIHVVGEDKMVEMPVVMYLQVNQVKTIIIAIIAV